MLGPRRYSIAIRANFLRIRIVRPNPDLLVHLQEVAAVTKAARAVEDLVVDLAAAWLVALVVAAVKSTSRTFVASSLLL